MLIERVHPAARGTPAHVCVVTMRATCSTSRNTTKTVSAWIHPGRWLPPP